MEEGSIPTNTPGFVGPIRAALIAGAISFIVTIITKDQQASEFRQAGIDGLKEDVSALAGNWRATMDSAQEIRENGEDASVFTRSK